MASSDKDVPSSLPTSPSTPLTSAAADVSAHRTCPRCTKRMSSLKYDKHSLCVACRDVQCSVDVRCSECQSWSTDFMLGYVKHKKPLVPVAVVTTAPVVFPSPLCLLVPMTSLDRMCTQY